MAKGESKPQGRSIKPNRELTEQQKRILRRVALRQSNKQIAKDLCISVRTVQNHLMNISRILNTSGRRQCVQEAKKWKFI
jgi:DNA-binding CsgD family transcriptional regulator